MGLSHIEKANDFVRNETQFHLGFLPTEQRNPKTMTLDKTFAESTEAGVRMLQSVDRDVLAMARSVFGGSEFAALKSAITGTVAGGGKVVFSGCGATGRLSILLESMWRHFFAGIKKDDPALYKRISKYEDSVFSIMTGGDFALVRSVESFEDHIEFGCRQARDMGISKRDCLVAITEGGETSSVLGTVFESVERGAKVFLLFNNPARLLSERLERCRKAIENPAVTVLDLHCGPMALTGSTRMQATTSEQLIAGAALESALSELAGFPPVKDYAAEFERLLSGLESPAAVEGIAKYIELEEEIYRAKGLVTYYAGDCMLDIFTDTTERAPTFMLPPFKRSDDNVSPPSLAFVKSPLRATPDAWTTVLGREPRCLSWTMDDYKKMGACEKILMNPPRVSRDDLMQFMIGSESDLSRLSAPVSAAVMVAGPSDLRDRDFASFKAAFDKLASSYSKNSSLVIGEGTCGGFSVPLKVGASPLALMERLAVKLVLNTVSTGTMVRLGKVTGNWMSSVEVTNKKLMDRGVRIISSLCGVSYERACGELQKTLEEFSVSPPAVKVSPVRHTMERLSS